MPIEVTPTKEGLYLAHISVNRVVIGSNNNYNALVYIKGIKPFLKITKAVFVPDGKEQAVTVEDVMKWGPEVNELVSRLETTEPETKPLEFDPPQDPRKLTCEWKEHMAVTPSQVLMYIEQDLMDIAHKETLTATRVNLLLNNLRHYLKTSGIWVE